MELSKRWMKSRQSLDMSDMVGAVANNWMDLLTRSDNLKKGDVLKKWQDATQKSDEGGVGHWKDG